MDMSPEERTSLIDEVKAAVRELNEQISLLEADLAMTRAVTSELAETSDEGRIQSIRELVGDPDDDTYLDGLNAAHTRYLNATDRLFAATKDMPA